MLRHATCAMPRHAAQGVYYLMQSGPILSFASPPPRYTGLAGEAALMRLAALYSVMGPLYQAAAVPYCAKTGLAGGAAVFGQRPERTLTLPFVT